MKQNGTRAPGALGRSFTALLAAAALLAGLPALAFDLQGHRGTRGNAPENTLPAFDRALEIGVTTLELDIGITADGVVVISHDPYLNPAITRDAHGRWLPGPKGPLIKSLTFAQLQQYDVGRIDPGSTYAKTFAAQQPRDGTRVPTLASLFDRVRSLGASEVRFNIETKINPARPEDTVAPDEMVEALLRVVREAGMVGRVSIQSFDWRTLRLVRQLEPAVPTVCLTVQTADNDNLRRGDWTVGLKFADYGSAPKLAKAALCDAWSPNAGAVTEALVLQAHSLDLKVVPWTVDDPADMDRLIGWGVDGLITDYPDRLRPILQARGVPLPAPVRH